MLSTQRLSLLWISFLIGFALFTRGFLLTRIHVPMHSTINASPVNAPTSAPFSKAMLLIVDALRLDFLVAREYSVADGLHVGSMQGVVQTAGLLVSFTVTSATV